MTLKFEAPPPSKRGRGAVTEAAEAARALRKRPQEWAIVRTYELQAGSAAASLAQSIRNGTTASWRPAGAFEATSRQVDGEYRVYARYVAEPAAEVAPEPEPAPEPVEPVRLRVVFDRASVTHIAQVRDGRVHTLCGMTAAEKALANPLRKKSCAACLRTAAA